MKKAVIAVIMILLLGSCVSQKPVYDRGKMSDYHKKLEKWYEKEQRR